MGKKLRITRDLLLNPVANSGSTIPGLSPQSTGTGVNATDVNERHFGWASNPDYKRELDPGLANSPWAPMQFNPGPEVEEQRDRGRGDDQSGDCVLHPLLHLERQRL